MTFFTLTLSLRPVREQSLKRSFSEWCLDWIGLFFQGAAIPLFQILASRWIFNPLLPDAWTHSVSLGFVPEFLIGFIGVDYLYYWNHRLLHTQKLWSIHRVHHSAEQLDLFVTSRNTLWTPLLMVYLWAGAFALSVLKNPSGYALALTLTSSLDLWRHTSFGPRAGGSLHEFLSRFLVTPSEHRWHHSREQSQKNFGANFIWWDRLHGTAWVSKESPVALGIPVPLTSFKKLIFPFQGASK